MLAAGLLVGAALAGASQRKILRYGGGDAFMPFEWLDAPRRPLGFQVDLIREVGREVTVELDSWARTWARLEAGEIDVVAMYDQPSRRAFVDFSTAFEAGSGEIFVRRGSPPIHALSELSGREAIVAGTMLRYHGAVFVESQLGRGTRIRLLFPLLRAVAAAVTATAENAGPGGCDSASSAILIVDDNDVVREMLIQGLRRAGYAAHAATEVEQTEAILDVALQRGSGLDLLRRIREQHSELPVIVVSGGDDAQVRERLTADTNAVFLPQPFALSDLLLAFRELRLQRAAHPGTVLL